MPTVLRLLPLAFFVALLVACETGEDRVVPPGATPSETVTTQDQKRRALNAALDTLQALVTTLERVQDPIAAWNEAAEVNRLLKALERDQASYVLEMSEEEAMSRYPKEIDRLKSLEAQRNLEMNRIMEDGVTAQALFEEMSKAEKSTRADTSTN